MHNQATFTSAERDLIRSFPPRTPERLAVIDGLRHKRRGEEFQTHYEPQAPYTKGYQSGHYNPITPGPFMYGEKKLMQATETLTDRRVSTLYPIPGTDDYMCEAEDGTLLIRSKNELRRKTDPQNV